MKIIFLDIDGVLNCDETPNPRKFPYIIDKKLLTRLRNLLERTNAKVVLSSSWRCDPIGLLAASAAFTRPAAILRRRISITLLHSTASISAGYHG
jgi:hypothetical protein